MQGPVRSSFPCTHTLSDLDEFIVHASPYPQDPQQAFLVQNAALEDEQRRQKAYALAQIRQGYCVFSGGEEKRYTQRPDDYHFGTAFDQLT